MRKKKLLLMRSFTASLFLLALFISAKTTAQSITYKPKLDFATGGDPYINAIGDIDGDGKPDIVVANSTSNTISVLRNTSSPGEISSSSFANKLDFGVGARPVFVALSDLDGDGKQDVAVTNLSSSTMSILRNTSTAGNI